MIQKEIIKIIADRILGNVKKMDSTGLYNSIAGLSLSLFVASEYLQDDEIYNAANDLLSESLLIRNNDISFENGLSGVGYALLYLVENNYVEADFDEVFGKQYETVIQILENIEKNPLGLLSAMQTVYFLTKAGYVKQEDNRIQVAIQKIIEGLAWFLTVQFHDFDDIYYIYKKQNILYVFNSYLKLVDYSGYPHFSRSLLDTYELLYQKGRIISSLEMGYYLNKISIKNNIDKYDGMIHENIKNGIKNIHLDTLSLRERIDLAKVLSDLNYKEYQEHRLLPEIAYVQKEKGLQDLSVTTPETFSPLGYGAGLGRLLIYCVDNHAELL